MNGYVPNQTDRHLQGALFQFFFLFWHNPMQKIVVVGDGGGGVGGGDKNTRLCKQKKIYS